MSTVFIHSRPDCPLHRQSERIVITGTGPFTPPELSELRFALKYAETQTIAGDDSVESGVGLCECNSVDRVVQFYSEIPGWLVERSSAVSESEADDKSETEKSEDGDTSDASQSGQTKPKAKQKKGGE